MKVDNAIFVSLGVTKNMGNYNTLRLDAGVTINLADPPAGFEGLTPEEAYEKAWELVDDQIEGQLKDLKNE